MLNVRLLKSVVLLHIHCLPSSLQVRLKWERRRGRKCLCSSHGAGIASGSLRTRKVGSLNQSLCRRANLAVLLQHQKSKHFKCQQCPRKLNVSSIVHCEARRLQSDGRRSHGAQSAGSQMRTGTVRVPLGCRIQAWALTIQVDKHTARSRRV